LVAMLRRGGMPTGRDLEPEAKWAEAFPFIIRDETSDAPRLDYPPRGQSGGLYQVRRAGRGLVRLTTPTGLRPYDVEVGGPGCSWPTGLSWRSAIPGTRNGWDRARNCIDVGHWSGSGGQGGLVPTARRTTGVVQETGVRDGLERKRNAHSAERAHCGDTRVRASARRDTD